MSYRAPDVTVVGGGLAGCEAAWQLAEAACRWRWSIMKPAALSPAHQTPLLCELVCSNSLGRTTRPRPPGCSSTSSAGPARWSSTAPTTTGCRPGRRWRSSASASPAR